MAEYSGAAASNFPQTTKNRDLDSLKDELASFSDGGSRDKNLVKAQQAIFEAIRSFNSWAWTFNRVTEDITLVASTADYSLAANWRNALRAQMVDSSSNTRNDVSWIPWSDWVSAFPDQSTTGSIPLFYTARNVYENGLVTVDPVPASTLTYPTLRLFYHRRILCPVNGSTSINAPTEVEQAIFDEAIWRFLRKVKSFRDAREALGSAILSKALITQEHRDFEDYYGA